MVQVACSRLRFMHGGASAFGEPFQYCRVSTFNVSNGDALDCSHRHTAFLTRQNRKGVLGCPPKSSSAWLHHAQSKAQDPAGLRHLACVF